MCSRGVKNGEKWKDSIVNFCQYFNLKVGVIGQVGVRVWAGNQYFIKFDFAAYFFWDIYPWLSSNNVSISFFSVYQNTSKLIVYFFATCRT